MAKARLTKAQKYQLEQLREYGPLYVGGHSPAIMRTFECLVNKGYVRVTDRVHSLGKQFEIISEEA